MIANQRNNAVGYSKTPSLRPDGLALRDGVDQATTMLAEPASKLKMQSLAGTLAVAAGNAMPTSPSSCQQKIRLSFFFDGTGNNLDADIGTGKHSNVVNPCRAHATNYQNNAVEDQNAAKNALLRAKARHDVLPDMTHFASLVKMYDRQLLADARAIQRSYAAGASSGTSHEASQAEGLRPHYEVLMEAYENKYFHNKGLKDEKIISFFDNLVHDSLAGFAKDATLPSDLEVAQTEAAGNNAALNDCWLTHN